MKRTTFTHHKLVDLAAALGVGEAEAVGTLGFLWHAAGEYAEEGDIGRFTDAKIAWLCRWKGDPKALVDALVASRWVDAVDGPDRLVIHDWPDHCEDAIHAKLARKRAFFANKRAPSLRALRSDERDEAAKWYAANTPNGPVKPPKTTRKRSQGRKDSVDGPSTNTGTIHTHAVDNPQAFRGALAQPSHALAKPSPAQPDGGSGGLAPPGFGSGGSGASTVADALARIGVNAASIAAIADCPEVTMAEVRREWAEIVKANGTVRSRPGLLVTRLCNAHGIQRGPPKTQRVGDQLAMARLQKLRENRGPKA